MDVPHGRCSSSKRDSDGLKYCGMPYRYSVTLDAEVFVPHWFSLWLRYARQHTDTDIKQNFDIITAFFFMERTPKYRLFVVCLTCLPQRLSSCKLVLTKFNQGI